MLVAILLSATAMATAAKIPTKLAACAACHGQSGLSLNPAWPHLAGQPTLYLNKQLQDFKKGMMPQATVMTAIAASLSEQDMRELTNFYAGQPPPQGTTPKKFLKRGELLYRSGDFAKQITACITCHGPSGRGNAQAGFPLLSGQHALYTLQQLQAFKRHKRRNDLNSIMQAISSRMSKEDMEAVAYYVQGLD